MLVKVFSSTYRGIKATMISIEVHITQGIRFFIVGWADSAIRESQQRIESALVTNGFSWPRYRVVINLAPADIRKEGTHFDLPLAIGILAASKQVDSTRLHDYLLLNHVPLPGCFHSPEYHWHLLFSTVSDYIYLIICSLFCHNNVSILIPLILFF